jgi:hypothetical protein
VAIFASMIIADIRKISRRRRDGWARTIVSSRPDAPRGRSQTRLMPLRESCTTTVGEMRDELVWRGIDPDARAVIVVERGEASAGGRTLF